MRTNAARWERRVAGPAATDPILWALENDQSWYEDLARKSRDLLCIHDLEGHLLSVNSAPAALLGYRVDELLRIPMRELIAPEFRPQFEAYLQTIVREGEARGLLMVLARSGERHIWEYHNTLHTAGTPVVRGMAWDITKQKRIERELRKSQERYRSVIAVMAEGVILVEADGRLVASNRSAERIMGLKPERLAGTITTTKDWEPYMIHEDGSPFLAEDHPATVTLRTGQPQSNVCIGLRQSDGGTRWLLVNSQPLCHKGDSQPYAAVVSFADITERREAAEKLKESEARVRARAKELETVLEAVPVPVMIARDAECRQMTANRAGRMQLRLPEGGNASLTAPEGERPTFRYFRNGAEIPAEEMSMQRAARIGEAVFGEPAELRFEDGTVRHVIGNAVPLFGENGKVRGAVGAAMDVTDWKEAQGALRKSEEQYRSVVAAMAEGVVLWDAEGRIVACNQSFERVVGMTEEQLLGATSGIWEERTVHEDGSPFEFETHPSRVALRTGKPQSNVRMGCGKADGAVTWISINACPMFRNGESKPYAVIATYTDITQQKLADEALRRSEAELKETQRVAHMGSWRIDVASGVMSWSEEIYRMLGLDPAQPTPTFAEVGRFLTLEGWNLVMKSYQEQLERGPGPGIEVEMRRLDGTTGWVMLRGDVDRDATGKVIGLHGGALDITGRKQAEQALRESEERLRLAQNVAKMGVFERNFLTGASRWMPEMEEMYGLPAGGFPKTLEGFFELVYPEDRPQVQRSVEESFRTGEGEGEWRVVWPDGTAHWIAGRWRVFRDAEGRPVRAIGIDYEITERRRVEEELRQAKEKLAEEKLYLEQEIDSELGFEEIVGQSAALKEVMQQVGKVARSDATVLLLGDTGTGKELVARALHRLSSRGGNSFIKMNCAAIPSGLLESELFGHEKGAFTGAIARKLGRLELADQGTLFLDEVGEIPLMLQPKLLRVLQDMEFERLGGTQTIKVNFRLIAASNRDLGEAVRANEFRSDLYYRLNVFPIRIPTLRERRDDIRLLVEHFVGKCSRRMGKTISSIPKHTIDTLMQWDWPGNVRELEHFIERSVILTHGSVLAVPLGELAAAGETGPNKTLEATEREHILRVLRESRGRISGPYGAAARLGLKRTTLQSKLKQMGIDRHSIVE